MATSISSGHSAEYLTREVAEGRESYYLDATTAGEPPGRWWGAGAEALGLTGEVDNEVFTAMYAEFADPTDPKAHDPATRHEARRLGQAPGAYRSVDDIVAARLEAEPHALPERKREIRQQAEREVRQPVMFIDATFSPVKSYTVLHTALHRAELDAQRTGDEAARAMWAGLRADAEAAMWAGNNAMLSYLSDRAGYARTGRHGAGAGRWTDAHDWIVGSFHQGDSRDHDPQQHVHNAILNRVKCADGKWRALDSKALHAWKQAAGAYGERVMEEELTRRLGVRWELRPDGAGREIVDISRAAMELFSSRSRNISKQVRERVAEFEQKFNRPPTALELTRLRQQATLATRRSKEHAGETREAQLERWDRELRAEVAGGLHQVAEDVRRRSLAAAVKRERFSPSGIVAEAVAACQETRSAFSRSELERHITMRLPHLGGLQAEQVRNLVTTLADKALDQLVEVTGRQPTAEVPAELRLADGRSSYATPSGPKYAAKGHIVAEQALQRAAVVRGRARVSDAAARRWLADNGGTLGADQAAALRGILTSGAAVSMLIGPAGTGKSYTLGQLAAAWSDLRPGGRVIGLATAQVAADVLTDDGVRAMNTERWLATQGRLESGHTRPGDALWKLDADTIVVVDESSMADLDQVARVRQRVEAVGGRLLPAGDPEQLAAVGAGGVMDIIGGVEHADVHHLSEVRRYKEEWEGPASLRLRAGDTSVLAEYDRHGRIRDGGTIEEAMDKAARAYTADVLAGRASVIICDTNEQAAQVARRVRDRLVAAERVEAAGIELARDGNTIGRGDLIQARKIDRGLNVSNRELYTVTGTSRDGGLVVTAKDGSTRILPASYVSEHVTLGYAGTVHAAEGLTVTTGHQLITQATSRQAAYVGLGRGQQENTAWVVTRHAQPDEPSGQTHTRQRRDQLAVMADILEQDTSDDRAALTQAAEDARASRNLHTIAAHYEDGVRQVSRARMDQQLDEMAAAGVLTADQRQALAADQGSEQLSRLLRAIEQAGHDARQALHDAVTERSLDGLRSYAQGLHHRLRQTFGDSLAPSSRADTVVPAGVAGQWSEYLMALDSIAADRRRELGSEVAQQAPEWAVASLGPVPDDPLARVEWEQKAGEVAAYREATGWDHATEPVGPAPGLSSTERRASWHEAWSALGRPDTTPAEHEMSDGALRNRVRAWEREQTWAPPDVYAQQRATEQQLADARRDLALAQAAAQPGRNLFRRRSVEPAREQEVAEIQARVEALEDKAQQLETVAQGRADWLVDTAMTREFAERAEAELATRGRPIGDEDDLVTAEEWLEEHRRAMEAEEQDRPVTETDIDDAWTVQRMAEADQAAEAAAELTPEAEGAEVSGAATTAVVDAELADVSAATVQVEEDAAEQTAEEVQSVAVDQADEQDQAVAVDPAAEGRVEESSEVPTDAEVAASVAAAQAASAELANRRAAEEAHAADEATAQAEAAESSRVAHERAEAEAEQSAEQEAVAAR